MSTATNLPSQENTIGENQNDEDNSYLYGRKSTASLSLENPEIRPRSLRKLFSDISIENQVEDIRQQWNGTVIDCNDEELTARLEDLTNRENPDEIVVLSVEEIEPRDQFLIQKGAMFFWHIGYRLGPKYPMQRFSKISFRRLPKWTEEEIQEAEQLAKEYADFFHPDSTHTT